MELQDKIILITGGSKGLGAEMAKQLSERGAKAIICSRNAQELARTAERLGVDFVRCDVTNDQDIKEVRAYIEEKYGRLDMLINNAGILSKYDFMSVEDREARIRDEIAVNCTAPITLTSIFLPLLQKSHEPAIVFVSSGLAYLALPAAPLYSGTKALMHHAAQTLRYQLKAHNIQVFELLPPPTDTDLADSFRAVDVKLMPSSQVVAEFLKAVQGNQYEIAVGISKQIRIMSRLAPRFLFNRFAKTFESEN